MGSSQSCLEKGDLIEWYLKRKGSSYDLYGRVVNRNQEKGEDRDAPGLIGESILIGQIARNPSLSHIQITNLENRNFTLDGKVGHFRLPYYDQKQGWVIGNAPSTDMLDIAYEHIGSSIALSNLDNRNIGDIERTRGIKSGINVNFADGTNINFGKRGPSLSKGNWSISIGGGYDLGQLRDLCNQNGLSCRKPNGKLLTRPELIKKLNNL